MAKRVIYEFMSLDGCFEGPKEHEMDFVNEGFLPEIEEHIEDVDLSRSLRAGRALLKPGEDAFPVQDRQRFEFENGEVERRYVPRVTK